MYSCFSSRTSFPSTVEPSLVLNASMFSNLSLWVESASAGVIPASINCSQDMQTTLYMSQASR